MVALLCYVWQRTCDQNWSLVVADFLDVITPIHLFDLLHAITPIRKSLFKVLTSCLRVSHD